MKTRMMSSSPGEFSSMWQCALYTAKTGPLGFFKVSAGMKLINRNETIFSSRLFNQVANVYFSVSPQGYVPAFVRLGPQTVLTFIFVEQLRKLFPKT